MGSDSLGQAGSVTTLLMFGARKGSCRRKRDSPLYWTNPKPGHGVSVDPVVSCSVTVNGEAGNPSLLNRSITGNAAYA